MEKKCKDLPEECWELIFNRLPDHTHFDTLSLVCKKFLYLTNRLRIKLSATDPTILVDGKVSKLLNRFPYLNSLDFSNLHGNIDVVLFAIANSCLLNLQEIDISNNNKILTRGLKRLGLSIRSLKVFKCKNLGVLRDSDLVAIANSLPLLEELDISYPRNDLDLSSFEKMTVTDAGIKFVAMNLKNLRRINVSGHDFITDKSLICLSMNCAYLEGIEVHCQLITSKGVLFLLRNCANLSSISIQEIKICDRSLGHEDSVSYGRCLQSLEVCHSSVSDEFLCWFAKASPPLKRLSLHRGRGFSFSALLSLLCNCQSLQYLDLGPLDSLTDVSIRDLLPYLRNLVTIKIYFCSILTDSTFYTLAKSCPLLEDIAMEYTNLGKGISTLNSVRYTKIRSLNLASNMYLNDECLRRFALVCPNLEKVDVSTSKVTEDGIAEVLDVCREIKHLSINNCSNIKTIREGLELPKLEVLHAVSSAINDGGLAAIGRRCSGLLKLDLRRCEVTTRGVEEVVRQCKSLSEINLKNCTNVDLSIVDLTVFSRPSLKKIIPPWYASFTEKQRRLFLRHGCPIRED